MDYGLRKQKIGDIISLRLDVDGLFEIDEFALNMMNCNEPKHLISVQLVQRDSAFYLQYDVNGMQTLESRLSQKTGKKGVIHILNSIITAFEEIEDYMLSEDILVLDMSYTYIDGAGLCRFVCVPRRQENPGNQLFFLRSVVEQMLMCYTDEDTFLYDLINAFNRNGIRKLSDVKDLLRKLDGDAEFIADGEQMVVIKNELGVTENPQQINISSSGISMKEKIPEEQQKLPVGFEIPDRDKGGSSAGFQIPGRKDASFSMPDKRNRKSKNKNEERKEDSQKTEDKVNKPKTGIAGKVFRKSNEKAKEAQENQMSLPPNVGNGNVNVTPDMYESYEETVIVTDEELSGMDLEGTRILETSRVSGILTRRKTQERFFIDEGENIIGSGRAAVCVIVNNKAISRFHLILRLAENQVSVMDNYSSNGTWVDGKRLIAGEEVLIRDHAVIKLADEEFVFTLNRQ